LTESILSQPPLPNLRDIKRQAVLFLEGRDKAGMAAQIAALQAQIEAMAADESDDKPKRGRPRKETEPAQEADAA